MTIRRPHDTSANAALAILLGTVAIAQAQDRKVTVELQYDVQEIPSITIVKAKTVAEQIFASIGVKLRWTSRGDSSIGPTNVVIIDRGQMESHRGALAYSQPFLDAAPIHVLYDRIPDPDPSSLFARGAVLGHVIAHELSHVLQRGDWHAKSGLMKATWSAFDFHQMTRSPLFFTSEDAQRIRAAVARR
jgi:hypothetical protein